MNLHRSSAPTHPPWLRLRAAAATMALASLLAASMPALADPPGLPPSISDTAVMVSVATREQSLQEVVLTYRVVVPQQQVRQDLKALAQQTGWIVERVHLQSSEDPLQPALGKLFSVEFSTAEAFDPGTGRLPVEPLVLALRRYRRLLLVFDPGESFHYTGRLAYHDRSVDIRMLSGGGGPYRFLVSVADPTVSHLDIAAAPAASVGQSRSLSLPRAAAALAIAALIGGAAFVFVLRWMLRREGVERA